MTPLRWALVALGFLLVANVMLGADRSFAKSEARRWQRTADSLAKVSARVDTIYRDRVRTLTREVVKLDTLTETVHSWKTDTVAVVQYVERADSTVRACLAVVSLCEERVALRDQRIAAIEGQLRATEALRPTLRDKARTTLLTIGLWEGGKAILRAANP